MKRFNIPIFNPVVADKKYTWDADITVPDLSFSIRDIMENFGKGLLDINVLKAQQRDELHLSTGVYDPAEYSAAIKETISNYDKAVADRDRILQTLRDMQTSKSVNPSPVLPSGDNSSDTSK